MQPPDPHPAQAAAVAVARQSYGKLIAFLAARTRDVAGAEDALAEAFALALDQWPRQGVPSIPEAWLLTVARRKLVDAMRQRQVRERSGEHLLLLQQLAEDDGADAVPDERLGLMFACAHPAIDAGARAPLMLQTLLGFDAAAIASSFLVAPSTMGQRLVRAKAKIRQAGIALRVPEPAEMPERLDAVLDAIYVAFTEGWADPVGGEAHRRNLAEEALWLGALVAASLPQEPEALGLLALMLHAQARAGARRDAQGDYVPLDQQDTALWDAGLIRRAEQLLRRAGAMGRGGRFQLEAAVQSAHAARRHRGGTDWAAIEQLYGALWALTASPVVAVNRAVALCHTQGAVAAKAVLDTLEGDVRLGAYQPYWAARADVLARLGDTPAAVSAYDQAIGLETDPAVRRFLQRQRGRWVP